MSRVLKNPADRAQVCFAVLGPIALLLPFTLSSSIAVEVAMWIAVWTFLCRHNYILHNHVHCPFTTSKCGNRVLGLLLGFCTGMTVGNWKITHVHGHHVEHKLADLPTRSYARSLRIDEREEFSVFAGVKHALRTAPIQWALPICLMLRGAFAGSRTRRIFYRYHLAELVLIYGTAISIAFVNPIKALFYFGVIYYLVFVISRYMDYLTHADSHGGSRYSIANVCLHPSYNKAFWNFGFHVAHHVRPAAHWTTLPAIHAKLGIDAVATPVAVCANVIGMFSPAAFRWHRVRAGRGVDTAASA